MRSRDLVGRAVAVAVVTAASAAHAGDALDKPSFTATADELLAAATSAPAGDWPAVILRSDDERSVDDDGRVTSRWRWVFVIRSQAGVDDWGTLQSTYRPFYQDRPEVKARVIDPSGAVAELDQSLVTDAPEVDAGANIFSDTRNLEAPLPRLKIGAVVEEEVITKDRVPVLEAGGVEHVWIGAYQPVLSTRITLSAPIKRKATVVTRELPAAAKLAHTKASSREQWAYTIGKLDPHRDIELNAPGDTHQRGYVGLATAANWAAVAKGYNKLVDGKIDEGPVTLPAGLPTTASIETVAAIVAWLHEHVRYTGIEFGEASNIPWTPAETVKRGFGDCKDKATLLIAMLRQAGITADLALLATGPGLDLDPDLPGMGVFDHAIVRARVGKSVIWIDATSDLARPGQLPADDQGRQALVIDDATRGLVMTPASTAKDNVIREVRTYALAETGAAKVTEVTDESGTFEPGWRAFVRDIRADDMKKRMTDYADDIYRGKLDSYRTGDATALDKPLQMTIVAAESNRAFTTRDRIDVHLFPSDALPQVPRAVTDDPDQPRTRAFQWQIPHVYEIENRLEVPPGYTVPTLPKDRARSLGTTTLKESFRVDGTTVIATYRFDSGKVLISAKELTAIHDALALLRKEDLLLRFEQTGWSLADRGKYREALAEIDTLIKVHPKEAIHHTQRAYVLIQAGMGDAARRAARKAVELEPKNVDAYVVLGWTLRHDTLGRDLGFDHDRAGAIAADKKALALDPTSYGANSELADLLSYGTNGRQYDTGCDLVGAAKLYRAALASFDDDAKALALTTVLLWDGKAADAELFARSRVASVDRDTMIVVAVAMQSGGEAAVAEAKRLRTGTDATNAVDRAMATLMVMGRYDEARAVRTASGASSSNGQVELLVKRMAPHALGKPSKDPRASIDQMIMLNVDSAATPKVFWDARAETDLRRELLTPPPSPIGAKFPLRYWRDTMLSVGDVSIEGKGPWRAVFEVAGQKMVVYLALDGGVAKIVGTPGSPDGVGRLARKLAVNSPSAARAVLDWLRKDLPNADFATVWGPGLPTDKEAVRLAAGIAAGGSDVDAIPVLDACKSTVTAARGVCDQALSWTYMDARRWDDLLDHATDWLGREADTYPPTFAKAFALMALRRFDEADKVATDYLGKHPDTVGMQMIRTGVALGRGNTADALQVLTSLATGANGTAIDLNQAAWLTLADATDLDKALELAKRADTLRKDETHILNTLAAIQAEQGDLAGATTNALRAMVQGRRSRPDSEDSYVIGRIAEQLGLRDDAIAAYKRVGQARDADAYSFPSAFTLADKRLKAMGVSR